MADTRALTEERISRYADAVEKVIPFEPRPVAFAAAAAAMAVSDAEVTAALRKGARRIVEARRETAETLERLGAVSESRNGLIDALDRKEAELAELRALLAEERALNRGDRQVRGEEISTLRAALAEERERVAAAVDPKSLTLAWMRHLGYTDAEIEEAEHWQPSRDAEDDDPRPESVRDIDITAAFAVHVAEAVSAALAGPVGPEATKEDDRG